MIPLVVDTGPLLANIDAADEHHGACASLLASDERRLIVPAPVLVEFEYWCRKRLPTAAWQAFLDDLVEGVFQIHHQSDEEVRRAGELCIQYRDLGLGYVDASVLAACEALGVRELATVDRRHFRVVQPAHCDSLELLPDL